MALPTDRFPMCYGTEFVAKAVRDGIDAVGTRPADIEPDSPRENGDRESFNAKLRDELLNGDIFSSPAEARIVIGSRRRHYNAKRPPAPPGYRRPAPEGISWPASPVGAALPATPAVAHRPVMHQD